MKIYRAALSAAIMVLGLACAGEEQTEECELPGLGKGACCDLELSSGGSTQGVCLNNFCTNGVEQQANSACESAPAECEVIGLGSGSCCSLRINGALAEGACIDGQCTDGHAFQTTEQCDPLGLRDRGILDPDAAVDASVDASPPDASPGDTGGVDGTPNDMTFTDDAVPDLGTDSGVISCDAVICDVGDRCDPATGLCVAPPRPAGPCEMSEQCPNGGTCLTDGVPDGFCRVVCADDVGCGDGNRCLPSGNDTICFDRCDDGTACREGWTCVDAGEGRICLPDCRVAGCTGQQACNEDSGLCEDPPVACPYACQAGEECLEGHCVRQNGTCVTDYHCPVNTQQCSDGRCVVGEFTDCQNVNDCDAASQTCVPRGQNPADGGLCLFACQNDEQCPADKACYEQLQACYFMFCGPAGNNNGTIYGACDAGSQGQWAGTCLPQAEPAPGDAPGGICLEAGSVVEGGACNNQQDGRTPADRALQCGPGMLCFGDPDDGLDPGQNWAERGECSQLCDPRNGVCNGERRCINFSTRDDAATPVNETRHLGLCLNTDCQITQDDCAAGQHCRTFSFLDGQGQCAAAGDIALGQACQDAADCADHAICANAGNGPTCLGICDPDGAPCPNEQQCFRNEGWAYGVCIN